MPDFPKCAVDWCQKKDQFCDRTPERKCLFHCDKTGWFKLHADGSKDWFVQKGNVNRFWRELKEEKIDRNDYNFSFFVFPLFPADNPFMHANAKRLTCEMRFTGAVFLSRARFGSIWLIEGAAFFDHVTFTEPAEFSHMEFKKHATFSDTRFLGGVSFAGIFYAEAHFRNVFFSPNHPTVFNPYHPDKKYSMFKGITYFTGINFPKSVAFKHVDLSHVSFGQSNLEEVRLLGCIFNKVGGRYELFDERRTFERSGGLIPTAYFGVVEDMYRQLKFNFESRKDWRNAGEFYASEMAIRKLRLKIEANDLKIRKEDWSKNELQKLSPKVSWHKKVIVKIPKVWTWRWWRRSLERFFLGAFGLVSFYGEQPDRTALWIVLLLSVGSVSIYSAERCADFNSAMLTTVRAVTFQQENNFDLLSRGTQWLITLLRVGSAVLLPLFLLALRRRFKR